MSESANVTPQPVTCPACGSKLAPDGKTLFEKSERLTELEKTAGLVAKLEKKLATLEEKLRKKPEPSKAAPVTQPEPAPAPKVEPKKESSDAGRQPWFKRK
ncbi:MAG: hypothetical protein A4C66_11590 [Nitrospira sp. HN-bin3]|uniref:hypothetical protein n=1 Tax=Nitrospira cf. moscoviensis SBR1015 TaxID=96242 RepID=UPI000A0D6D7C|nr:hypothetical protein [Nitrospira cf. moscoviensis SBR1015]OQW38603.1 MAG: hypothetical protein A4C66_11590 [Nitrospira sp. HN-bin3]